MSVIKIHDHLLDALCVQTLLGDLYLVTLSNIILCVHHPPCGGMATNITCVTTHAEMPLKLIKDYLYIYYLIKTLQFQK